MNNIIFKPWVGDNYKNTNPKIMVMGESAYYWEDVEKEDIEAINKDWKDINK